MEFVGQIDRLAGGIGHLHELVELVLFGSGAGGQSLFLFARFPAWGFTFRFGAGRAFGGVGGGVGLFGFRSLIAGQDPQQAIDAVQFFAIPSHPFDDVGDVVEQGHEGPALGREGFYEAHVYDAGGFEGGQGLFDLFHLHTASGVESQDAGRLFGRFKELEEQVFKEF